MKTARALARHGALLGLVALAARADNTVPAATPVPTTPPPAATSAPVPSSPTPTAGISSPTVQSFPIPPSLGAAPTDFTADLNNDPERIAEQTYFFNQQKSKDDAAASLDAAQRQQVYDDNWMMRGYAEQLKKRGLALSPELNSLLVADPNAPKSPTPPDSLLAQPATAKKMIPLRPTSSLLGDRGLLTPKKSLVNGPFQPLVSPIYDPGTSYKDPWASTASLEDDMASLANNSGASLLPVPGSIPEGAEHKTASEPADSGLSSLLDIPGLTAETQGAVAPNNALAFQDPGENETTSPQHPRTSASNFLVPTAPTNDISEFFKKQAMALQPPTAPTVSAVPVAPGSQRLPLTPPSFAKPPITTPGMRMHIDDPFDILRR